MTSPVSPRAIVEVTAGTKPAVPDDELTHRWEIPNLVWDEAPPEQRLHLAATMASESYAYAGAMMVRPERATWVRVEWTWVEPM